MPIFFPNCSRGRDVLDAELERLLRDADRFERERGEQPQPHGLELAVERDFVFLRH